MKLTGPIIIIDDDKDDQIILEHVITKMRIQTPVLFFDDCISALAHLRDTNDHPFIILCDINLPSMNGLQFRNEINKDERLRRKSIPFVFLTTSAMRHQVIEAYDLTVQGFFVKQITLDDMQLSLRRIFDYWLDCVHPNTVR